MQVYTHSITNPRDGENKDRLLIKDQWFTICDGVSSRGIKGAHAAQMAIDFVEDSSLDNLSTLKKCRKYMIELNEWIHPSGGSTTFTSVFIKNDKLILMHTGDSECYIIRDSGIQEITKPFTVAFARMKEGMINPSELKRGYGSNILLECLDAYNPLCNPQIEKRDFSDIKGLILCTDGVNYVEPKQMLEYWKNSNDPALDICRKAKELGSLDDITSIVVRF